MVRAALHASLTAAKAPVPCAVGGGCVALGAASSETLHIWDLAFISSSPPLLLEAAACSPQLALSADADGATTVLAACAGPELQTWRLQRAGGPDASPSVVRNGAAALDLTPLQSAVAGALAAPTLAFEPGAQRLAVLSGAQCWVFGIAPATATARLLLCLDDSASALSACTFGRWASSSIGRILLTAAEDRTFQVWSLDEVDDSAVTHADGESGGEALLLVSSSLPPGSSIISAVASHPTMPAVLIGDAAGIAHCFELQEVLPAHRLACVPTHKLDVPRLVCRQQRPLGGGGGVGVSEVGGSIIGLAYIPLPSRAADAVLGSEAFGVLVSLPDECALIDSASWQPVGGSSLLGGGGEAEGSELAHRCIFCAGGEGVDGGGNGDGRTVGWMLRAAAFEPIVRVWRLSSGAEAPIGRRVAPPVVELSEGAAVESEAGCGCTVLPSRPPERDSPLTRALATELPPPAAPVAVQSSHRSSSGASRAPLGSHRHTDQPVTFHKKVSSSGYGQAPIMRLHAGGPSTAAAAAARAAAASGIGRGAPLERRYQAASAPPTVAQEANCAAAPPLGAPLLQIAYAPDSSRLALAAADGSVSLLRLPTRRYYASAAPAAMPTLTGHSGAINSISWSHSGRLLLVASADGAASVWDVGADRPPNAPLMRMQHVNHSPKLTSATSVGGGSGAGGGGGNPLFSTEVRDARFFYLDRLMLLASGNALHTYAYSLQKTPTHDAQRAAELRHRYRLAHTWRAASANHLTCVACANSFLSPITLVAASDRSVVAIDLGRAGEGTSDGAVVTTIPEAHERAVHSLRLAEGSAYADTPAAGRDLFLTAALDSAVKLWDLRSASCVRTFAAHTNRIHQVRASLSPCLRFVACGSEERAAYVYDAGSGALIQRLKTPHDAVVSDAAFSPLHPQLALGGLDGHVRFYADRAEEL